MTSLMLINVISVLSMFLKLSKLPPRVCWRMKGGGVNIYASCLVAEQAVEFPHVLASCYYFSECKLLHYCTVVSMVDFSVSDSSRDSFIFVTSSTYLIDDSVTLPV